MQWLPCRAVPSQATKYHAKPSRANHAIMRCHAMRSHALPCSYLPCHALRCHAMLPCRHGMAQQDMAYGARQGSVARHGRAWHGQGRAGRGMAGHGPATVSRMGTRFSALVSTPPAQTRAKWGPLSGRFSQPPPPPPWILVVSWSLSVAVLTGLSVRSGFNRACFSSHFLWFRRFCQLGTHQFLGIFNLTAVPTI